MKYKVEYSKDDIKDFFFFFFKESCKGFLFNKEQCQKNLNKLVPNANLTLWFPNKDLINQGKLKCIASLKHGKTNVFNLVLLMI